MADKPKVFCIGLSRTATQSLVAALEILGWHTVHYPRTVQELDTYDAGADITVSRRFRYLDLVYPGAKFILTTRERKAWLASCQRHFDGQAWRRTPFEEWTAILRDTADNDFAVYGSVVFHELKFETAYELHDQHVRDYFAGRDNLLILDIADTNDEELWRRLCEFVDAPIVADPFPWENRSQ